MPSAGEVIEAWHGARVATNTETTDTSTFTTTETVTDEVTAPLVDGERYLIEFWGRFSSSAAGDDVLVSIRVGSVSGTRLNQEQRDQVAAGLGIAAYMRAEYTAASTGDVTFVVTGDRVAGTGNITRLGSATAPSYLTVTHIKEA